MIEKEEINLLQYTDSLTQRNGLKGQEIFDPVRKTWLLSQPEEFVRQLFIQFLIIECHWSLGSLSVEKAFKHNQLLKRWDLVAFDEKLQPKILFEFKSPEVALDAKAYQQLSVYCSEIRAPFLILSNGLEHRFFAYDLAQNKMSQVDQIPSLAR